MCKLSKQKGATQNFSFRIPISRHKEVHEQINNIADTQQSIKNKGDVLFHLLEFYKTGGSLFKIDIDDPTIQNVIDEIIKQGCAYLKYEDESLEKLQCYETMLSKKKPTPLSPIPERTLQRCIDCIKGKLALKQLQYEKKLEKDMIKKILNFRDMLMTMVGEGFVSEVYFCTGEARNNQSIIFSNDNITLPCSLNEMELVKIEKVCMNTVNPKTNTTPCKYLIMDKHIAKLKKKDFKTMEAEYEEVREALPQLEHQTPIEVESEKIDGNTSVRTSRNYRSRSIIRRRSD